MAASLAHASRFALLKIEDDDDDNDSKNSTKKQKGGKDFQQSQAAKKKNQKKKRKEAAEAAELRNLAFGGKGANKPQKGGGDGGHHGNQKKPQEVSDDQWQQWKKSDTEFTSEVYEKDLQQALLLSKLEFEQQKEDPAAVENGQDSGRPQSSKDKKKKKKDKPVTMSLDSFITNDGKSDDQKATKPASPPPAEPDPKFFDKVESDVTKIIQKEKIQEEYKKHYIAESARSLHYQEEIEKRDKELLSLKGDYQNLEEELKQVKKRNKQLCFILGQGEMKDKADVLLQVQELTQIRDELTQEVSSLTSELEKERSKVHALKAELDKSGTSKGRHGSK